jgi:hypothetical protein
MKSVNLEQAYARLWAAVENGTVDKEFSDLREEARHFLSESQQLDREAVNICATLLLDLESDTDYENLKSCYPITTNRADRLRHSLTQPKQ